ncbi:HNH endonuclease signature motif containing protein [Rhizobium sp. ZPR3]|uniref:HNH endonuclease signature motif containing protein n=2 Tax=unclassified Rhizobium TaxID=2613769 RepID=A0AAU7SEP7_9HYPH
MVETVAIDFPDIQIHTRSFHEFGNSYFMRPTRRIYPANRAVVLKNARCAYCGIALTDSNRTRDHVIGRRFVPKGKLNGQWNLILNACRSCNNDKSDLENDIAAITLAPDPTGRYSHDDMAAIQEARRRAANSISRRTKKPVQDSRETLNIGGSLGPGVTVNFSMVAPPQIDEARAFELARLHLVAFFFMQTYSAETCEGRWWLHGFHPVLMTRWEDWGNPVMRGFMREVEDWDNRLHAVTADGFFKLMTRRHPSADCWAWAIEWNRSHRLIGFFGEREPAQEVVNRCPPRKRITVFEGPSQSLHYSPETALSEDDDTLFKVPAEVEEAEKALANNFTYRFA